MTTGNYKLSKEFIEDVRSASDVVRVIGRFVKLRKRGKNHIGLCPFHDEKTPSFNVSPDRQMFYCFGCGAGGDVFEFMMRHENMSFAEAVVDLAKQANLQIPERTRGQRKADELAETIVGANEAALEWFRANLAGDKAAPVREYLAGRGIDEAGIEAFEIGFAPESRGALRKHLGKRFSDQILEAAGLLTRSSIENELIDRFRKRIIVPIRSAGGRLVAFGGRIFGDGEPKFLNTPETQLFHKSRNLFGLNRGARKIRRRNFAILVEGYFDALALHMSGFENAVAPLGTSLTEEQAKLLRRYADKTIICMDADEAGQRAAVRAAGLLLAQGFAVNIAPLPEGDDPDSFVRANGADAFRDLLKESQPAYIHVLEATAAKHDLSRPAGKRSTLEALLPLMESISDPIERSHAVSETARTLGLEESIVAVELGRRRGSQNAAAQKRNGGRSLLSMAERKLLIAAAKDPEGSRAAVEELGALDAASPLAARLLEEIFTRGSAGGRVTFLELADLVEDADERKEIAALAVEEGKQSPESAWECAVTLAINAIQRQMAALNQQIGKLGIADEEAEKLVAETIELKRKIISLEKYRRD